MSNKNILQDDANWWQATMVDYPNEPAKLVPSRELEERRRAFVRPEADYTTKIGLCGTLVSRKKKKQLFQVATLGIQIGGNWQLNLATWNY